MGVVQAGLKSWVFLKDGISIRIHFVSIKDTGVFLSVDNIKCVFAILEINFSRF